MNLKNPSAKFIFKNWKSPILLFIILFAYSVTKAQDYYVPNKGAQPQQQQITSRLSFAFSVGAAVPLGDFGSNNVKGSFWDFNSIDSTRLQGFALTGFHFDVSFWYRINDFLGIELYYGGNSNSLDINGFSNTMGYVSNTSQPTYYTPEYLIGPYYYFREGNKFTCKLSAMIGLVTNTYPDFNLMLNDTTTLKIKMNNGGSAFAYSFSAQLEYMLTPRTSIYLNAGYTGAKISYAGWTIEQTAVGKYYSYSWNFPDPHHPNDITFMNTAILKVSAGFIFSL